MYSATKTELIPISAAEGRPLSSTRPGEGMDSVGAIGGRAMAILINCMMSGAMEFRPALVSDNSVHELLTVELWAKLKYLAVQ